MANPKILVVDDEEDLCEILRFNLEAEEFVVDIAHSAEEVLAQPRFGYSLYLFDVMMERMSGYELAETLRSQGDQTPVIFLTARDSHHDQLHGFSVGADDYITKPFSFDTVLARIKAVLRRTGASNTAGITAPSCLTKREHLILQLFSTHPGHFFSREEILSAVWPGDTFVGERSVDVHVARLRKKLGPEGSRIVNKTGFGYGLV
ncbi:MAG: response regulator transcription factor [Bacteroidales bacterium]|nr:response regulator transcription factor [Bacteroidales bacterium]